MSNRGGPVFHIFGEQLILEEAVILLVLRWAYLPVAEQPLPGLTLS